MDQVEQGVNQISEVVQSISLDELISKFILPEE